MSVLELADVTVVRGGARILDRVTWRVEEGERWVILGPNGAGKTTLLQIASARLHPTTGRAEVLGERLGAVDVFELRPRIGLTSAALAETIPPGERVLDVVMSASYAVTGRWREEYLSIDSDRAADLLALLGVVTNPAESVEGGDKVLVLKPIYDLLNPSRHDTVVFKYFFC